MCNRERRPACLAAPLTGGGSPRPAKTAHCHRLPGERLQQPAGGHVTRLRVDAARARKARVPR